MTDVAPAIMEASRRQRLAADPTAGVWVNASAGTGKTKVLTDRVLRLLLIGTAPEKLLCITFTKAAAAEMEERVARRLAAWATAPEPDLAESLTDLTGEIPNADQVRYARQLFARVLDTPGGLNIRTIHAFAQSVLRRFPLEAGIAPTFEAMDEAMAATLMRRCRRRVLTDPPASIKAGLTRLADTLGQEGFEQLLSRLTGDRAKLAAVLADVGGLEGLRSRLSAALEVPVDLKPHQILLEAVQDAAMDRERLGMAAAGLRHGSDRNIERAGIMERWLLAPESERLDSLQTWRDVFIAKTSNAPLKQMAVKAAVAAYPDILDVMNAEAERLLSVHDRWARAQTLQQTLDVIAVGDSFVAAYEQAKRADGALDYDDLILKTARLLSDADQVGRAAWVLFKLDGGIDHLLVDEAQDTSPDQWRIIASLVGEFYAGISAADEGRTLFVVGDGKQSIYSFQGADPAEFERLRSHFAAQTRSVEQEWRPVAMTTSFRSTEPVLTLVDQVFRDGLARDGVVAPEEMLHHLVSREGMAGAVDLWPITEKPKEEQGDIWVPAGRSSVGGDPRAVLADRIATEIRGWLDGAVALESRGRPIEPGDILILVRRRDRLFAELVRALTAQKIPVAGVDRLVLTNSLAVEDLLAVADTVLLPQDDLSLATVLKGPFLGWDDDDLMRVAMGRGDQTLTAALRSAARRNDVQAGQALEWLDRMGAGADFVPPFEFLSRVLMRPCPTDPQSGRRAVVRRMGAEAEDAVDALLNQALAFEAEQPAALTTFLAWLRAGETELKRELDQRGGLVRLMTVHGAKGLQAPVVFLPDTVTPPQTRATLIWPDAPGEVPLFTARTAEACGPFLKAKDALARKDQQEYRRLLYVALTRAEDRLIVCGAEGRSREPKPESWYALVEAGFDRLPGTEADGAGRRRYSRAQTAPPDVREVEPELALDGPLPPWALRPPPPEPTPSRPLTPTKPTPTDPAALSPLVAIGRDDRFRRGRVVHRLLQTLPDLPANRRREAGRRYLAASALGLSTEDQEALLLEAMAVLNHPDLTPLFGPGSRAEVPIAGLVGDRVLAGQVDRLAVEGDTVWIVDYKTNRPPPLDTASVPHSYLVQMALYRAVLSQIYPERQVACVLVWTDQARWMRLPNALLDSVLQRPEGPMVDRSKAGSYSPAG